jgi:hypothetical protein
MPVSCGHKNGIIQTLLLPWGINSDLFWECGKLVVNNRCLHDVAMNARGIKCISERDTIIIDFWFVWDDVSFDAGAVFGLAMFEWKCLVRGGGRCYWRWVVMKSPVWEKKRSMKWRVSLLSLLDFFCLFFGLDHQPSSACFFSLDCLLSSTCFLV